MGGRSGVVVYRDPPRPLFPIVTTIAIAIAALNNILGGPRCQRKDLAAAAWQVVAETGDPEAEHISPSGEYSHSVLAKVLLKQGLRLELNPMKQDYRSFLADESTCGALVNEDNHHWIALVKHSGLLWHVDSRHSPRPLDEEAFRACLEAYPNTFRVLRPSAC